MLGGALEQLLGDAIDNDGIPDSSDSEEETDNSVRIPDPLLVDPAQQELDDIEERAAQLAQVGVFVLPHSHASYSIKPPPSAESLPDLNSKWNLLKEKLIAHKTDVGWKIGKVWKKGKGQRYGGQLWVTYGRELRAGYEFDPNDY